MGRKRTIPTADRHGVITRLTAVDYEHFRAVCQNEEISMGQQLERLVRWFLDAEILQEGME